MASSTNLRLRSNVAQYESSGGVQPESFASKVEATRSKLIVMFVFLDSTFKKYIFVTQKLRRRGSSRPEGELSCSPPSPLRPLFAAGGPFFLP